MSKRWKATAGLAAFSLLLTSCGARVAPYLSATGAGPQQATSQAGPDQSQSAVTAVGTQQGNPAGGGGTSGGAISPSGAGTATATNGARSTTGPSGPASTPAPAALTVADFNFDPQAEAAYCTGTAGNTSSAPGVTPTSITVGNVSGLTGAVADSFGAGLQSTQAVFDAVNRFGGICGRQLKIASEDDQQNSSNNAADVSYLIPKVLAFVGSLSDGDNGGVSAMEAANIPDIGAVINVNRSNAPTYWSGTGGSVTVRNGRAYLYNSWLVGLKQNGDLPSSVAVLSYSIPISAQAGAEFANAFQQMGVKICYSNYSIPPAPGTVMGSVVQSMQQHNCGGVFTTMDVVGNADMLQDMQSDDFHPKLVSTTYEGYNPDQISLAGNSAAQGLSLNLNSQPLGSNNPGVQLYQSEMSTYEPGQLVSEFGIESWSDAEMFIYALLKAGRNPTRAGLTSALGAIQGWTGDGSFGPYTPNVRTGNPCGVNVVYRGNNWVKTWPSSGFFCTGQFIDVGAAK